MMTWIDLVRDVRRLRYWHTEAAGAFRQGIVNELVVAHGYSWWCAEHLIDDLLQVRGLWK